MSTNCGVNYITSKISIMFYLCVCVASYPGSSPAEKWGGAWVRAGEKPGRGCVCVCVCVCVGRGKTVSGMWVRTSVTRMHTRTYTCTHTPHTHTGNSIWQQYLTNNLNFQKAKCGSKEDWQVAKHPTYCLALILHRACHLHTFNVAAIFFNRLVWGSLRFAPIRALQDGSSWV